MRRGAGLLAVLLVCVGCGTTTGADPVAAPAGGAAVEAPLNRASRTWRAAFGQAMSTVRRPAVRDSTCRQVVRLTAAGSAVRLRLSNATSTTPVTLASVTVGRRGSGAAVEGRLAQVRVAGAPSVRLSGGDAVVTDPVRLPVRDGDELLVSVAVRGSAVLSEHLLGAATGYCSGPGSGDLTQQPGPRGFDQLDRAGLVVDEVDVLARPQVARTVVAAGDSLTDPELPADTYPRWTDALVAAVPGAPVVNVAIAGNRVVLPGGYGPTLSQRFDRDVLDRAGVGTVVVLAGTNDISTGIAADELQGQLAGLVRRGHAAGIRVVLATIPPAARRTASQRDVREQVNSWIRSASPADAVVDADAVLRDSGLPSQLAVAYDHGDGLHLSPAGHRALAAAVAQVLLRG